MSDNQHRHERAYGVGEIRLPRQRAAQVAKYWGLHVNVYLTAAHKWPCESWLSERHGMNRLSFVAEYNRALVSGGFNRKGSTAPDSGPNTPEKWH